MNIGIFLQDARDRIAMPEHWCKGDYARNRKGQGTFATDPAACAWCLLGTLEKSSERFGASYSVVRRAIHVLIEELPPPYDSLQRFNDNPHTTHERVVALLDRGIKACVRHVSSK